ncbi:MAG: DUF302 domain-containing protein [Acetobacteraceae bacterium]|nr:DUF302 domain-containing protein [Pseudomonadota bacterium]
MFVMEKSFGAGSLLAAGLIIGLAVSTQAGSASPDDSGVVKVRSHYAMNETIDRLKHDIAAKGITFFNQIDQSQLAAAAGITTQPSTLLIFGNPALGTQFIVANPSAGLDWPVRLLVTQDSSGQVWAEYTDFHWIARRHHIRTGDAAFTKASEVIASITASVEK